MKGTEVFVTRKITLIARCIACSLQNHLDFANYDINLEWKGEGMDEKG